MQCRVSMTWRKTLKKTNGDGAVKDEKVEVPVCCANCVFGHEKEGFEGLLFCHAAPPQLILMPQPGANPGRVQVAGASPLSGIDVWEPGALFPPVLPNDTCGHFMLPAEWDLELKSRIAGVMEHADAMEAGSAADS